LICCVSHSSGTHLEILISNTVIQYVIHCHVELFQTRRSTAPPVLIEDD
jgi:hypothetical protein